MPATKRQIRLDIVATETHCGYDWGQCEHLDQGYQRCAAFPRGALKFDSGACTYKRLPECIAAETAGDGQGYAVRCAECRNLCSECAD